MSHESLRNM